MFFGYADLTAECLTTQSMCQTFGQIGIVIRLG